VLHIAQIQIHHDLLSLRAVEACGVTAFKNGIAAVTKTDILLDIPHPMDFNPLNESSRLTAPNQALRCRECSFLQCAGVYWRAVVIGIRSQAIISLNVKTQFLSTRLLA
jgi:hypothetical protein